VQLPDTHVWFVHAFPFTHCPAELHVCGCVVVEHRPCPGVHATHNPLRQTGLAPEHAVPFTHAPPTQVCGCAPEHLDSPAEQTGPPLEDPPLELDDDELPLPLELDEPELLELPLLDAPPELELLELEVPPLDPSCPPSGDASAAASGETTCEPVSVGSTVGLSCVVETPGASSLAASS